MKRPLAALTAALLLTLPITAQAAPPAPNAVSAILVDAETGRVLFEKNAHERRLIASITKLMTALVAVESTPDLTTPIQVEREWTLAEGSSIYLQEGETVTLETLLYGLLLNSGNDAALAVAGGCAGEVDTFVDWMNQRAADLGMEDTHFVNPNGLNDEEHYSTAWDMAILARECLTHPELRTIMSTKSISREGHSFANHNKLLWQVEGCIGMKTGYTQLAGRTLVSAAERDGQTLVCVTLADPDDWADHAALLDYGFQTYPRHVLALAGRQFRTLPVEGSLLRFVTVQTSHDVFYPLTGEERVRAVVDLPQTVQAPVKAGTIAGSLTFLVGEEEIGKTYLLYGENANLDRAEPWSPLGRVLDFLRSGAATVAALYPVSAAVPRTYRRKKEKPWKSGCKRYSQRRACAPAEPPNP